LRTQKQESDQTGTTPARLSPPPAVKPREGIVRRELAPTHGHIAVEGEQARWRAAFHEGSKRRLVLLA
jgi:hypothetical protein